MVFFPSIRNAAPVASDFVAQGFAVATIEFDALVPFVMVGGSDSATKTTNKQPTNN